MNAQRLVLVTGEFWPRVGSAERAVSNLASQLAESGHAVTIVTARWEKRWPRHFVHRGIPVVRLEQPKRRGWGAIRYMRQLSRWLRAHRQQFDAVVVSQLKHDAYAVLNALAKVQVPVILRAERGGATGECEWLRRVRLGERIAARCREADAVVAVNLAIRDELADAGFSESQLHVIADGVRTCDGSGSQAAARSVLADAHRLFELPQNAPLVVYAGWLHESSGAGQLVDAWPEVLRRRPTARAWLLGAGPFADTLWEKIKRLELENHVILPGSFDELDDVLRAADLLVAPNSDEDNSLSLLEAMAVGTPIIASDTPGHRHIVTHGKDGWLTPAGEVNPLAQSILHLLSERQQARRMAVAARKTAQSRFAIEDTARAYLELSRHKNSS